MHCTVHQNSLGDRKRLYLCSSIHSQQLQETVYLTLKCGQWIFMLNINSHIQLVATVLDRGHSYRRMIFKILLAMYYTFMLKSLLFKCSD